MSKVYKDIVIIGGGASGIACAISAGRKYNGKKITILEKQSKIGRKLLSTGNGRCNFTNINSDKENYHGSFAKYIDVVFEKYSPQYIISFFNKLGLVSKVEAEGRVYPHSNHASSVVDTLRYELERLNIEIVCDSPVVSVKRNKSCFDVVTDNITYAAEKVVFTTGSAAGKKLGADESGINILKGMGHKIMPLSPALCPIYVDSKLLKSLKGLRSTGKVSLISNGKLIKEDFGEIQFTEKALSGICVFNLSAFVNSFKDSYVVVSLLPNMNENEIYKNFSDRKRIFSGRPCEDFFTGLFHKKLGMAILKECNIPVNKAVDTLSNKDISRMSYFVNNWKFKACGLGDYSFAQVTSGGVIGSEIDPLTMESKVVDNLYICGEAVDVNGDCGGYNLQFAFASGMIAGDNL